jgi:hypothetical protein
VKDMKVTGNTYLKSDANGSGDGGIQEDTVSR